MKKEENSRMIKEIKSDEFYHLKQIIETIDIARNYFILLGLSNKTKVYDKIYGEYKDGELKAVLFIRKSGLLQFFAPGEYDINVFSELIASLVSERLIGPKLYCHKLLDNGVFSIADEGAYISKLEKDFKLEPLIKNIEFCNIGIKDLDEIIRLYQKVFQSFSPKDVMEEKFISERGRGICIRDNNRIISVAQTDFETVNAALIVGVATEPDYRNKGYATECTKYLSIIMQKEGKDVYLQYDNPKAGKIYERLGYKTIDRVVHYRK